MPISVPYSPILGALAAVAALGFLVSFFRGGKRELTIVDALILTVVIAIVGATAIPLFETVSRRAKAATLLQNLHALRSQIALYKLEHDDDLPVLYQGGLPQLIRATNDEGIPGPAGNDYPYGPYLRSGVPVNPFTGRSVVSLTDAFPPAAPSGNGGWLYHQATGQIAADLEEYLSQ
ncbi:MAG: type II secretion system protein [Pirellulales bacterium]|nr:type II secretion system protein [Pirellulales bacterium]